MESSLSGAEAYHLAHTTAAAGSGSWERFADARAAIEGERGLAYVQLSPTLRAQGTALLGLIGGVMEANGALGAQAGLLLGLAGRLEATLEVQDGQPRVKAYVDLISMLEATLSLVPPPAETNAQILTALQAVYGIASTAGLRSTLTLMIQAAGRLASGNPAATGMHWLYSAAALTSLQMMIRGRDRGAVWLEQRLRLGAGWAYQAGRNL